MCFTNFQDNQLEDIQEVANSLVNEAHKLAFDPTYLSPFAVNAAANGFNVVGKQQKLLMWCNWCT